MNADFAKTVDLQFERFCVAERIDPDYVRVDAVFDRTLKDGLLRIERHVLHEVVDRRVVTYPKTWWDAFKLAHFPKWLQRRYPPIMWNEVFDFVVLYPDFQPALSDIQRFRRMVKLVQREDLPLVGGAR